MLRVIMWDTCEALAIMTGGASYAVTRDGQRFLMNVVVDEASPSPIVVVENWPAVLKK